MKRSRFKTIYRDERNTCLESERLQDRMPSWSVLCPALVKKRFHKVLSSFDGQITGLADLFGAGKCSAIFLIFGRVMSKQLKYNNIIRKPEIRAHRVFNAIIRRIAFLFLHSPQIIEKSESTVALKKNSSVPIIWVANHRFTDDIAATIRSVDRTAIMMFGSIPAFFNTIGGLASWANGVILCNRKLKASRQASTQRAVSALQSGVDIIVFSEGVWNKTMEKPLLPFFPGIYKIAKETGAQVVPIIHYLPDLTMKGHRNPIHTIVEAPISIGKMGEDEALSMLRDLMATRYFELMEKYGVSTRETEMRGYDTSSEAWEAIIKKHTGSVNYYDTEIELRGDYRPKTIIMPEQVWKQVAEIETINRENAAHVLFAKKLVDLESQRDFQRRY